jgi:hypothetical protein
MMETNGKYYLGRIYDSQSGTTTGEPLLYDPNDLTTHAVVVGMTGSGKTGLCIDLLEEAALNGVPALMIDPKGDMTNTLLHFPELQPQDFQPWIDPDQARREDKTVEQAAVEAAQRWREGLAGWEIGPERLKALKEAAHFTIYTPGSDAGIPVNILASLKAPKVAWGENRETLREKISETVTALLGLVGLSNIDPVRSREHILLANIFEHAWSKGDDLDLGELILQIQTPPFNKLGVFDVNTFFPEKERFELAILLNNIQAAPAFQAWIEGQPLEIGELLYGPDGRPRHSVFYIAHLSDPERMFFVTLLYSAVESWMRAQAGTSTLRAIVYFDEIFGYLPPVSNPPCKQVMLRMLKQSRAFGVAQVLVTQNPVDLDYKALSNAGTWLIGKLQTDQDKNRLLDGLEGAMAGGLDRGAYDRLISTLGKRVFLLHNVHAKQPQVFQTRWAMNFLAGPLTRTQIPALNRLAAADSMKAPAASPQVSTLDELQPGLTPVGFEAGLPAERSFAAMGTSTRPAVPMGLREYILPNNLTLTQAFKAAGKDLPDNTLSLGILYRPMLLAQASIRLLNRKVGLDHEVHQTVLVPELDRRGAVRWEEFTAVTIDSRQFDDKPDPRALFAGLEPPLSDQRIMSALEKDFIDWAYRNTEVIVRANEELGVYAGPHVPQAEFRKQCADTAREKRDAELTKVSKAYDAKLNALNSKLTREERELADDQTEHSQRKMEEMGTHAETLLSILGKRRRSISSSLTKRRMTERAKAEVEESQNAIKEFKQDIARLEEEKEAALEEVRQKWSHVAEQVSEVTITPLKKDVLVDLFGVAWCPTYVTQVNEKLEELPGFGNAA